MLICNLAASFQLDLLTFNFDLWPLSLPWTLTSGLDLESWPLTYDLDLAVLPKVTIQKCQFLVNVYIARGGGRGVWLVKFTFWNCLVTFDLWLTLDLGEWPWPLVNDLDPWPWHLTLAHNLNYAFLIMISADPTLAIGYWTFTYDLSCLTFGWPLTLVSDLDLWCMTLTPDLETWPWRTLQILYLRYWNMWNWPKISEIDSLTVTCGMS